MCMCMCDVYVCIYNWLIIESIVLTVATPYCPCRIYLMLEKYALELSKVTAVFVRWDYCPNWEITDILSN